MWTRRDKYPALLIAPVGATLLAAQHQPTGGHAGSGRDQHVLDAGHLVDRGPAHLAHRLADSVHAVDVRLAQLAAVRVDRQPAADLDVAVRDEVARLPPAAKAQLLQLGQHEWAEMVVEHRGLDVCRSDAGHCPELARDDAHLRQAGDVFAVVAGHDLLVRAGALGNRPDHGRRLAERARVVQRRDDQRHGAVAFLAAVEEAQRVNNQPRRLVVLECDRAPMEPRGRIVRGMPAVRDRHPAEVLAGGAVLVHVAAREHCHPMRRGQEPEWRIPSEVHPVGVRCGSEALHAGAEAAPGATIESAIADDHAGHAGCYRHDGVRHRRASGASPVMDAAEERQVAYADGARDLGLVVPVHGERHHSVDVGGLQPCVLERGRHRLAGKTEFLPAGVLRELGGPDPDDGGPVAEGHLEPAGNATVTVPVTCSPRLLRPTTSTSTTPSRSPGLAEVTQPVIRMVSPARLGAPRRMAMLFTAASGPAQSVTNRPTKPLVVRMFMKMPGIPRRRASSTSWWTS